MRARVIGTLAAGTLLAALLAGTTINTTLQHVVTSLAPTLIQTISDLLTATLNQLTS